MFKTIAIRTMVNAPTIELLDTFKSRDLICQARGEQDLARPQCKAISARDAN